jgi:hypothetical protein
MKKSRIKRHHHVLLIALAVIAIIYLSPLISPHEAQSILDGATHKIGLLQTLLLSLTDLTNGIYAFLVVVASVVLFKAFKK